MTNYHWIKIQRDASNVINIYLDNTAIETQTSNAVFSLADNSYIFMGNTNRYFTGYEVIVDDILIFGGVVDATDTTPIDYLNPASFTMLLYIKVSDGSVWGYADDGSGGGVINPSAFPSSDGIDFPTSDQILRYFTMVNGSLYSNVELNVVSDNIVSSDITLFDEPSIYIKNSTSFIEFDPLTLTANSTFTVAFWLYNNAQAVIVGNDSVQNAVIVNSSRQVGLRESYSGSTYITTSATSRYTWHYIAIGYDADTQYFFRYVDGVRQSNSRLREYDLLIFNLIGAGYSGDWSSYSNETRIQDLIITNNRMFTGESFTIPTSHVISI